MSTQSMHIMSPSDIVGPSPVTSNGTETTEIEDDASEEVQQASSRDYSGVRRSEVRLLDSVDGGMLTCALAPHAHHESP